MHRQRGPTRAIENGQIAILVASLMFILLAAAGLAVDFGTYAAGMRVAQNQADAIALAAAVRMRDPSATSSQIIADAQQWAAANNVALSELTCCALTDTNGDGQLDRVSVTVHRQSPLFFMRVFQVPPLMINRTATARVIHAAAAPICPWGLVASGPENGPNGEHYGMQTNVVYALKVSMDLAEQGNFRGLDITSGGANDYRSLIAAGCAAQQTGMWQEGQNIYVMGQQGNLGEPTRQGLEQLYAYEASDGYDDQNPNPHAYCNVRFTPDPLDPNKGYPVPGSQFAPPKPGCGSDSGHRGRILIVPIIDHLPANANDPARVLGLASMYLAGWDETGPPSNTQVYGIFLGNATLRSDWLRGESDNPLSPLRVALVE